VVYERFGTPRAALFELSDAAIALEGVHPFAGPGFASSPGQFLSLDSAGQTGPDEDGQESTWRAVILKSSRIYRDGAAGTHAIGTERPS
jgi:hypothetical protein